MKILVVEDEHRIASSIKKGLEQEKYTVDVAYDGEQGLDMASTGDYEVIVLDLMLPKMDGLQVCAILRKNSIHTPILMLTAKSQVYEKIEGLNTGADDYLSKPFSFEELLARIRALSRRIKTPQTITISEGDLSLDAQAMEVTRMGKKISLSSREFSLLEYMLRNKKQILTKDQIINHVWNYDSDILPNTVEVYMKNLRNKIDKPFTDSTPLLHTLRGFGYKIEAS